MLLMIIDLSNGMLKYLSILSKIKKNNRNAFMCFWKDKKMLITLDV